MDPEPRFIDCFNELQLKLLSPPSEHDALRVAALLRQLLLDGGSLTDAANKSYHLKILFTVPDEHLDELHRTVQQDTWWVGNLATPPGLPGTNSIPRNRFLKLVVGSWAGTDYSVRDVITYGANNAGGVHLGRLDETTEPVHDLREDLRARMGYDTAVTQLYAIGLVVAIALSPLRDKILGIERFQGATGVSFHLAVRVHATQDGLPNYILDIGISRERNRLSYYIDSRGSLCFRCLDRHGVQHELRAGYAGVAFPYGELTQLGFDYATVGEQAILAIAHGPLVHYLLLRGVAQLLIKLHNGRVLRAA